MTAAFTFPGQGSQVVGMGKALADAFPAARVVFEEVDSALSEKLTAVIWDGPAETLQLTENAQPALMAVSLATLRVLETEAGFLVADAAFVAGHSLGEYSALAAAGSLTISDTARLLRIRGLAMQKAVPVGVGAMAALLGLDYETAVAVAEEAALGQVCQAANDNGAGQVVVSGAKAAIDRAVEIARAKGAKRAMLLPVSAPFHCQLMQPAADAMAEALAEVTIKKPASPLGLISGLIQIIMIDIVFSVDSIITAVGMTEHFPIMVIAVVAAVGVMMVAVGPLAAFIHRNPTVLMLALSFLLMIGMTLIADGFGFHIERGYIYAAMFFSSVVETLTVLARRKPRRPT